MAPTDKTKKTAAKKKGEPTADPKQAKLSALTAAMERIEKTYGRGAIMKLGDDNITDVDVIPSGSISLNFALGVGGFPRGRITEIYGPESSGKTTLALHAIAEAQKKGGIAALIDAEHAFDRFYAAKLGVDVDNLLISQPDTGEQALEIVEQLIRSSAIDIIVVDSVAALTPKAEIEGDMGDRNVGLQARLMSQAMRKLTGAIARTNTCCIFINQLRAAIGGMGFGPAETTTGGNALKFYASVRIDIRPSSTLKDKKEQPIGRHAKIKIAKNKVAPPFKRAEFDIMFGEGISRTGEIVDLGGGVISVAGVIVDREVLVGEIIKVKVGLTSLFGGFFIVVFINVVVIVIFLFKRELRLFGCSCFGIPFDGLGNLLLELFKQFGIVGEHLFYSIASLGEFIAVVAEP